MIISEIIDVIEAAAPLAVQESYDNSGLIVGDRNTCVDSALLCVDITEGVLDEAIAQGSGLIISHHPIIFHAIKKLTGSNYVERIVIKAIRHNIALYACHTNLDQVANGLSHRLGSILEVDNQEILRITDKDDSRIGFGIVGTLPHPVPAGKFLEKIKSTLNVGAIRHSNLCLPQIHRVAICTGSGASLIQDAKDAKADIYISADFKYNDFIDADAEIILADVGHFESEYCAIEVLYDIITKKLTTFALHKSDKCVNPINYFV